MKIVIDIPEEEYKCVQITGCIGNKTCISNAIYNGTPIPKGHGRLIDVDWIDDNCPYYYSDEDARLCYAVNDVNDAPTIIEADKTESRDDLSR